MAAKSFRARVSAWARKSDRRLTAIVRHSTQRVVQIAQTPVAKGGNMPVDTGFLRASLQSQLTGSTSLSGPESYVLLVAGMQPGQVAEFGWTASYAKHVEYGTRGRAGRHFVGNAAAQWSAIVADAVRRSRNIK